MKTLITGGAGFLGSHIADQLLERGHQVSVIDDLYAGRRENLPKGINLKKKSVAQITSSDVKGFDAVVHCAAQVSTFYSVDYPEEDFSRNAASTFHLFETCRKFNEGAVIIFTSSRSVLGDIPSPEIAIEDRQFVPSTFYNVHKIYGELLARIYAGLYGMKFVILRPSNVYGPRQPYWMKGLYNFISYWIKLALLDNPIPIFGTGEQVRDYAYVDDIARAFLLALSSPKAIGEALLLPTGRATNLNQLADMIIEKTKSKGGKEYFPARKGDVMRFVGSYEKAKTILGWEPKITLEEGLDREIEWVRKN